MTVEAERLLGIDVELTVFDGRMVLVRARDGGPR